ncbi:high mobility group B protein 10-like isoform X1 [Chenopodium quinoa]|uniref:high mobility group B protein 10-like isoform X1 n=1 Tax=Chenopodium quinoa TaxID=63459 RepID=UPI000B788946|nr:high mobility group B protein 10-like isoform X1 [Chenopodium quinoa]
MTIEMEMEEQEEENQQAEEKDDESTRTKCYPEILDEAEYHKLVQNSDLFLQKLKDFHSSFYTHFISPSVGGTTLDLHRLFVEVTSRGGLDQVISDRKWEEVVSAFNFVTIKRSFLLRKYYLSLLYHFEQAYFLKKKAPAVAITDAAEQITVIGSTMESTSDFNEKSASMSHLQASVHLQPGASLIGVIDEKLDHGYVVSVNLGSDTLKGVLYHIPDTPPPFWSPNLTRRRKRKKSQLSLVEFSPLKHVSQGPEKAFSNIGHMRFQSAEPEKQFNQDKGVTVMESDHTEVANTVANS